MSEVGQEAARKLIEAWQRWSDHDNLANCVRCHGYGGGVDAVAGDEPTVLVVTWLKRCPACGREMTDDEWKEWCGHIDAARAGEEGQGPASGPSGRSTAGG